MASEKVSIVPANRLEDGSSSSQFLFQEESLRYGCDLALPLQQQRPKTVELGGFVDEKMIPIDRVPERSFQAQAKVSVRSLFGCEVLQKDCTERRNRSDSGIGSGGCSEGGEDSNDNNEGFYVDDGARGSEGGAKRYKISVDGCNSDQAENGRYKHHVSSGVSLNDNYELGKADAIPLASIHRDTYYAQAHNQSEPSLPRRMAENGPGSGAREEAPISESVRTFLSDPITGSLMDDAVIFPCGHSFGAGGLQLSLQKKACYTCFLPITENTVHQNLTLRAAVAAFRREEQYGLSKRKREEKANICDSSHIESPRGRDVHFPFAVADRVVIMGNKRTPQHFVGREAVITTQCLNGWYVVKTLDTAETVKLQYRSLAKVSENRSSTEPTNKATPNWL